MPAEPSSPEPGPADPSNADPSSAGPATLDVSVVIPAYNAATTIAEQLDALERQDYVGEWEIVIALQRCDDDTAGVIAAHPSSRVRVVDASQRAGAGFARNVGVEAAVGRVIAFCDADDIVCDHWLRALMDASDSPVVAGSLIPFHGEFDAASVEGLEVELPPVEGAFLPTAYSGNMAVHRDAFLAVDGFNLHFHRNHDVDLAWRLQLAGYPIVVVPEAVLFNRQRATESKRWMQTFRWSRYEPGLYRRFRDRGMPRSNSKSAAVQWVWLVTRLPLLPFSAAHREVWLRRSAVRAGRLVGSITERLIYL
jgi:glycosyltransferase involved in cell wall biosynthesis